MTLTEYQSLIRRLKAIKDDTKIWEEIFSLEARLNEAQVELQALKKTSRSKEDSEWHQGVSITIEVASRFEQSNWLYQQGANNPIPPGGSGGAACSIQL